MQNTGFYKFILPTAPSFEALAANATLQELGKGRQGNHLVQLQGHGIPLVRTTTQYTLAAQPFGSLQEQIVQQLQETILQHPNLGLPVPVFNNALMEVYNKDYYKMGFHSDQALDLAADSYIALFSCYKEPEKMGQKQARTLHIRHKTTLESFEITLEQHSIVLFSLATNAVFQHKIVLKNAPQLKKDHPWLGLTFRQSKTFIHFEQGQAYFENGKALHLAQEDQKKTFYKLRGQENRSLDFVYPDLGYTISAGDLLELD